MSGQYGNWACRKHKRGLSPECQMQPCEDHLVLSGLFTMESIPVGYSSKEFQKLPVSLLKNKMITTVKDLFGARVTDCQQDVLHRYPEEDSRTIWKGPTGELEAAWDKEYGEKLLELTPIARCNLPFHNAAEFEGGRVAIVWKEKEQIGTTQAEIREGVE